MNTYYVLPFILAFYFSPLKNMLRFICLAVCYTQLRTATAWTLWWGDAPTPASHHDCTVVSSDEGSSTCGAGSSSSADATADECAAIALSGPAAGSASSADGAGITVTVKRNGANVGAVYFTVPTAALAVRCAATLASLAATALHVEPRWSLALRLYTAMGDPLAATAATAAQQQPLELHLLLSGETWVWPGVAIGHTWSVEGATLTTVSLEPRVIFVEGVLTPAECATLVASGVEDLYRSPEKHYSDDDTFKDYRTSHTASIGGTPLAARARARVARIARLPTTQHCEQLQLVRYTPGTWYKQHQDFYHGWEKRASIAKNGAGGTAALDPQRDPHGALRASRDGRLFLLWLKRIVIELEEAEDGAQQRHPAALAALQTRVRESAAAKGSPGSSNGGGSVSDVLQLALVRALLLKYNDVVKYNVVDEGWRSWLSENAAQGSSALLVYFVALHPQMPRAIDAVMHRAHRSFSIPMPTQAEVETAEEVEEKGSGSTQAEVEPNRHATLFLYLNDNFTGGETVFPFAKAPSSEVERAALPSRVARFGGTESQRDGMPECSAGLAVTPVQGGGALFYSKRGDGVNDPQSMHGGCPPMTGTKFGANAFCWNVNSDQGYNAWRSEGLI